MPLLEIAQNRRYVSAMVRIEETIAQRINQYAAFMNTTPDEVVDKALAYVFARDKDFQEWLQKPEAGRVQPRLRMRRLGQNSSANESGNGTGKQVNVPASAAGSRNAKAQPGME